MTSPQPKEPVTGYECRFAVYIAPPQPGVPDLHLVKEIVHKPDGTTTPNIRLLSDFKRPFWVTKKGAQNHQDKKEWEDIDNLNRFESTQTELVFNAAKALGTPWFKGDLRRLASSPYLYGADILSTAVIKKMYQDKFPTLNTMYTKASFDVETDVVRGTEEITMATLSMGNRVVTAVQKSFVEGQSNVVNRTQDLLKKYLSAMERPGKDGEIKIVDVLTKRGIVNWELVLVDSEIDVIKLCFTRAHEWKPDFVEIWNIDFDMSKILKACERAGAYPADIFSDPAVPQEYRFFQYKQGPKKKVTASGKVTPIKPSAQWHTVLCPSSFYFIDGMCAYRHIRTGNAEEPSYSLDAILKKHGIGGKLKFEEADHLEGIDWHQFMQERYPLHYIVYNVFDCISMEELDESINDLSLTLPLFSGCSDFMNFKSQPRRTADNLHYFCLQQNKVIGTTSGEMAGELDKLTVGLDGWIVTLPAHLVTDDGLQVIAEAPQLRTNIRGHVGDLDVAASYPNGGCVFNISKATTKKELVKIVGVTEQTQRMQGINLSAGHTNAVEFCTGMYGLPSMEDMLKSFEEQRTVTLDPAHTAMAAKLIESSARMYEEGITNPSPEDVLIEN